jgi:hypothetical protein
MWAVTRFSLQSISNGEDTANIERRFPAELPLAKEVPDYFAGRRERWDFATWITGSPSRRFCASLCDIIRRRTRSSATQRAAARRQPRASDETLPVNKMTPGLPGTRCQSSVKSPEGQSETTFFLDWLFITLSPSEKSAVSALDERDG